jgi:uncharacterized HAD superfamily protein
MEGKKQRLGFDLDGVLYPWHEVIYNYMKYEHKMETSYADFWKDVTNGMIMDWKNGMGKFWLENNLFLVQRDIKPAYLDLIYQLSEHYDIYYITSRVKTGHNATKYWFKRNKIPFIDNLYFASGEKLPLLLQHEIDIFVEDRVLHILELRNHTRAIMVRQPWNEELWDEVETIDSVIQLPELLGVNNENA